MKMLKICFFLFGLFFLLSGKAQAQRVCAASVSITSVPHEVSLNADNSIDIPITIESNGCDLTLKVKVTNIGWRIGISQATNDVPTGIFQTTLTVPNASVGTEYKVICGSEEYGFNDGGCTIVVVP